MEVEQPTVSGQNAGAEIQKPTSEELDIVNQIEAQTAGKFNKTETGFSGTKIFGEVYDEEYLRKLSGTRRADIFDEMFRSDDTITMLLAARKNPILKATWSIEPARAESGNTNQEEIYKKQAEHLEHELFNRMDKSFIEFLEEALTFIEHGFSLFERVHEIVNDSKFGTYVGYEKFAWRSQRTIERWLIDRSGKLVNVFQQADGDVGDNVIIPGEWLTVFTQKKRGDNYEGISALRPIYGNWQRKQVFLKLLAIGIERYAINTPVGTIPKGLEQSPERDRFAQMLRAISSHQQNYFTLPQGWEVEFLTNPFDADKIVKTIQREDEGMVKSFVANHLNLGQGGGSGSYALGTDLSDQFLSIIEHDAQIIKDRFQKEIVREFIDNNYGKQSSYPQLKVSGINDKFSKEFAEIIKMLAESKYLSPTENLERWLRKRLDLPELLEADAATIPDVRKAETPTMFIDKGDKAATIQLAEDKRKVMAKLKDQLKASQTAVAEGMQENLQLRGQAFVTALVNKLKGQPHTKWRQIIRDSSDIKNQGDYLRKLKKALAETAGRAISQARNEVPGGRKVKFAEGIKSRMSFAEVLMTLDQLPKHTKDLIVTSSQIVTDKQYSDLKSSILLTANGTVDETTSVEVLEKRLNSTLDKQLVGASEAAVSGSLLTAAGNLTAQVYNTSRIEFFQTPEVLESIEAFEFMNDAPVSPICQNLRGRIFAKNDPESYQWLPPLHHNCKSYILPVLDLQGKKISEIGLSPSKPELNKFKTI